MSATDAWFLLRSAPDAWLLLSASQCFWLVLTSRWGVSFPSSNRNHSASSTHHEQSRASADGPSSAPTISGELQLTQQILESLFSGFDSAQGTGGRSSTAPDSSCLRSQLTLSGPSLAINCLRTYLTQVPGIPDLPTS